MLGWWKKFIQLLNSWRSIFQVSGGGISINSHHTISKEKMSADLERSTSRIPQLDGPIPYDDDVLSTPNVSSDIWPFLPALLRAFVTKHICSFPLPRVAFTLSTYSSFLSSLIILWKTHTTPLLVLGSWYTLAFKFAN